MSQTTSKTISRRDALKAGSAIAATAVLGGATAAAMTPAEDPIFAVIEAHKAAEARYNAALDRQNGIEERLAPDRWKFDPEIAAAKRAVKDADEIPALWALVKTPPTTLAGVVAILTYAAEYAERGDVWPTASDGEDDWAARLHRMLAEAVTEIGGAA